MKVVIAIDSLKGSLSSIEAGMAIREGVLRAKPDAEVIVKPLADGRRGHYGRLDRRHERRADRSDRHRTHACSGQGSLWISERQ